MLEASIKSLVPAEIPTAVTYKCVLTENLAMQYAVQNNILPQLELVPTETWQYLQDKRQI